MDATHEGIAPFIQRLGQDIRARRKAAGLTVQALADRADLSRRMLTQIEQGRANPSMVTVDKIARALGVDFPALVSGQVPSGDVITPAVNSTELWRTERGSYTIMHIAGTADYSPELWEWRLEAGEQYRSEADPPGYEELFLVVAGALTITTAETTVTLGRRHAARVASDRDVVFTAATDEGVTFVTCLIPAEPPRS